SIGDEYIYLYESLQETEVLEKDSQPTIEELRVSYKELIDEKDNYDDKLKEKYEKNSIYWSDKQEQAIILYLKETDEDIRNRIFSREIYLPLKKLVENIIFTYKLFRTDIEVREVQTDCMSFLMTKLSRFNPDTGAKAFAYLGTIAKHYL